MSEVLGSLEYVVEILLQGKEFQLEPAFQSENLPGFPGAQNLLPVGKE